MPNHNCYQETDADNCNITLRMSSFRGQPQSVEKAIFGNKKATKWKKSGNLFYLQLLDNEWCTRRDLNSRPSTPEADALSN